MEPQHSYLDILEEIRAAAAGGASSSAIVDRAAGMLAGRVGCRVHEAQGHLMRLAREQGRDVEELSAGIIAMLEAESGPDGPGRVRSAVDRALRVISPRMTAERRRAARAHGAPGPASRLMQQVLDAMPGGQVWLTPMPGPDGEPADYLIRAASPEAVDVRYRTGADLVGLRVSDAYPSVVGGELWDAYARTLRDGMPRQVGPFTYTDDMEGVPAESRYSVRVNAVGGGLLVAWVRHDGGTGLSERIAQTERLGNLGWGEWDLVTGELTWSDQLYQIYERDPALGPYSPEESAELVVPEDRSIREASVAAFERGEAVDVTYRIRVGGGIKHVRSMVEAVRDAGGRPLRFYGIVQDITSREIARARLAVVERQLREHQRSLAEEHRLAAQLQQIVLPIPAGPVDLPGLRVAVRYLPAERASRVGGDWFHAAGVPDGSALLAVGDVAGHGIQAATTMAQLRHALAALAITTTTDPAELLAHLNRLLCAGGASTATAVVARYCPSNRTLTWAQAGHPAPLRTRGGATTALRRPAGALLGAVPGIPYENAVEQIEAGDLLLFFTDGLVEHRDRSIEEGLAPVIDTLNELSAAANPQPLAELLSRLRRANPNDDTCILGARPLVGTPPAV